MRCENIFSGEVTEVGTQNSCTKVKVGDIQLQIPGSHHGKLRLVIRPEDVLVSTLDDQDDKGLNKFHTKIIRSRDYGAYVRVELGGPLNVVAHLTHASFAKLKAGTITDLIAVLPPANIHVLPE
jgi:ABC-type molybdate transport system ATPase subunit